MKIIECTQGSADWLAIRAKHFTASEAPAMLGLSKYMSRTELLRQKATGITPDVDSFKQAAFDRGHEAEAVARPLAEDIIGEDLYPCTGALEVEGLPLLASFDGLTMDESVSWENKLHNDSLAAMVAAGDLDGTYWPQVEMQLLVSGATRALFTTCDGEKIVAQVWYESKPERRAQLLLGWHQFAEDLKTYTPPEVIPAAVAAPIKDLPALSVVVSGSVAVRDNLSVFGDALRAYIDGINRKPETDNDFADIKAAAVKLRELQVRLASAKESMLGQLVDVDTVRRSAEELEELARVTAIELEKIHEAENKNRKAAIIRDGQMAVGAHIANLNARLGKPYMPIIVADFAGKAKNLRTLASLQNAVDTELARVKIEANEIADRIEINLNYLRENAKDYAFLFADTSTIVLKQKDDFEALAKLRIAEHKEAEAKRLEAETLRIRAEEEAKARAEAAAAAKTETERMSREQQEADQMIISEINGIRQQVIIAQAGRLGVRAGGTIECIRETLAETEAWPIDDRFGLRIDEAHIAKDTAILSIRSLLEAAEQKAAQQNTAPAVVGNSRPAASATATNDGTGETPAPGQRETPQDTGKTVKLGEINAALGFTVTAEFLGLLGFHAEQKQNARLYRECDFPRICAAIARHCDAVGSTSMQRAA